MTKHDDHVHVPVMFTEYTENTNPNNEFAELTFERTIEQEREDLYVLEIWILATAANVLDRDGSVLPLGRVLMVPLERQARTFLHSCRHPF